jgi:hypothetical protein
LEELDAETGKDRDGIIEADTEDRVAGRDEEEVQVEEDCTPELLAYAIWILSFSLSCKPSDLGSH